MDSDIALGRTDLITAVFTCFCLFLPHCVPHHSRVILVKIVFTVKLADIAYEICSSQWTKLLAATPTST